LGFGVAVEGSVDMDGSYEKRALSWRVGTLYHMFTQES